MHDAAGAGQQCPQAVGIVVVDEAGRNVRRLRQAGQRLRAPHPGGDALRRLACKPRQQNPADGAVGAGYRDNLATHVIRRFSPVRLSRAAPHDAAPPGRLMLPQRRPSNRSAMRRSGTWSPW